MLSTHGSDWTGRFLIAFSEPRGGVDLLPARPGSGCSFGCLSESPLPLAPVLRDGVGRLVAPDANISLK